MYPTLGYTVVVLGNYDDAADGVGDRLRWVLTGGNVPEAMRLAQSSLQVLSGRYAVPPPPGLRPLPPIQVVADDGGLLITTRVRRRFLPSSPDEFFDESYPGDRLHFDKDATGHVISLTLRPAGPEPVMTATKVP